MIRRGVIALVVITCAVPAAAQTTQFLPRLDFAFDMERLSGSDQQFVWDANVGADVDVISRGDVRVGILGNYQVVMGNEFQPFDPNQGNYVFEATFTRRLARYEVSGIFYHQSRHLADRVKKGSLRACQTITDFCVLGAAGWIV